MALPLLLGLGLGYLGGASYLMSRKDERDSQQALSMLTPDMPGLMGAERNAHYENLKSELQQPGHWTDPLFGGASKTARARSLLEQYQAEHEATAQAMAAQAEAQRVASWDYSDDLRARYDKELSDLGVLQDSFQKGIQALDSNSAADVLASTFNFFNLVEPGGIVRDPEANAYRSVGGFSQEVANALNAVQGKGLNDETRNQLRRAMENQYVPRFNRGKSQRKAIMRDYNKYLEQGFDPTDPTGSEGINWQYEPMYQGGGGAQGQPSGETNLLKDAKASMDATIDSLLRDGWRKVER